MKSSTNEVVKAAEAGVEDDILAFTNCQSLADDFLAYCNNRFTMTCDGEAHWYLSVKYTRDPSGRVSASQELYIDKIPKRWGMES